MAQMEKIGHQQEKEEVRLPKFNLTQTSQMTQQETKKTTNSCCKKLTLNKVKLLVALKVNHK